MATYFNDAALEPLGLLWEWMLTTRLCQLMPH
jgi:hypothetical protein